MILSKTGLCVNTYIYVCVCLYPLEIVKIVICCPGVILQSSISGYWTSEYCEGKYLLTKDIYIKNILLKIIQKEAFKQSSL